MKRNLYWIGAAALAGLLCVSGLRHATERLFSVPRAEALPDDATSSTDTFKRVWTLPVQGYRAAALSPDGKFIGLVSNYTPGKAGEKLSLWRWADRPDKPLWSRSQAGASLVAVGMGGQTVLACARMNPMQPFISVRKGSDGTQVPQKPLDGAVWDVQMSADGQSAAVTTGGRGLYLFPSIERSGFHRYGLGGIGNTVSVTADNTYLTAGTWDESGVACFTVSGTEVWQYPNAEDAPRHQALTTRIFEVQMAQRGHTVLGVSYANAHQSDGTLYLWRSDGDGTPRWTHSLGVDTFFPKALISEDGQCIAVTYLRQITRGDRSISERRLLVLDQDGGTVWEKGNLLFSPTLVALAPDGHRITVSDGQRTLYNLNSAGRITAIYPLKGTAAIRETMSTPDGRSLLVYTSDGLLSLFQIG